MGPETHVGVRRQSSGRRVRTPGPLPPRRRRCRGRPLPPRQHGPGTPVTERTEGRPGTVRVTPEKGAVYPTSRTRVVLRTSVSRKVPKRPLLSSSESQEKVLPCSHPRSTSRTHTRVTRDPGTQCTLVGVPKPPGLFAEGNSTGSLIRSPL